MSQDGSQPKMVLLIHRQGDTKGWLGGNMGPCPLGPKEIDGLLVPPGKAHTLLTDCLVTGQSLHRKSGFKSNHPYK